MVHSMMSMHVDTCVWCGAQSTGASTEQWCTPEPQERSSLLFHYVETQSAFKTQLPACRTMKSHEFIPPHQSSLPNLSDFFEVVEVTAHEERRGSHDEVQHLTRQDGHKRVLPLQGVEVGHEALGHERQQGPVRGEEHDALFRQDTGQDLGEQEHRLLPVCFRLLPARAGYGRPLPQTRGCVSASSCILLTKTKSELLRDTAALSVGSKYRARIL